MKKQSMQSLVMVLMVLITAQMVFAQEKFDFRKTTWGMTKDQVLAAEGVQPGYDQPGVLGFTGKVLDRNMLVFFTFIEEKLVQGMYTLDGNHSNDNEYLIDFDDFKAALTEKYGKPATDEVVWKNDLYKSEPNSWGMAVSAGHVVFKTTWKTDRTEVALQLSGDNYKVKFAVAYFANIPELRKLIEEQKKKEKEGNL